MSNAVSSLLTEPLFLEGHTGRIFALYLAPREMIRGALLYIPPFGEEMNRSRSLVAEQARKLAELGYACLLLDVYGTGDSQGELDRAEWNIWRGDVSTATTWLEDRTGCPTTLWGLRLGALLAADMANSEPLRYDRMLLWQPVTDGKLFLTSLLRQRVAFIMGKSLPAETTDQMRENLLAGGNLEISGYSLAGDLARVIDIKRILDFAHIPKVKLEWFENIVSPDMPPPLGSQRVIDQLRADGGQIDLHTFTDPPLWLLHKRTEAPQLIEKTTALFHTTV